MSGKNARTMHGDCHIGNGMLHRGKVLLIDRDTLRHRHPALALASMTNACCGCRATAHSIVGEFPGIRFEATRPF